MSISRTRKELALGRMLGPFPATLSLLGLHINRFGVIPKGQLITDFSFPPHQSVNNGIDSEFCSLAYPQRTTWTRW